MSKPPLPLIVKWRDQAQEGRFYTDIAKEHPDYTASQIRHYCLGHSGAKAPGPLQRRPRWLDNPWLQGERSPHALLKKEDVVSVLDDWDEDKGYWSHAAGHWAQLLDVSPSTILAVRRGDTWKHLEHPNAGRKKN
jgi:hypothetical protein